MHKKRAAIFGHCFFFFSTFIICTLYIHLNFLVIETFIKRFPWHFHPSEQPLQPVYITLYEYNIMMSTDEVLLTRIIWASSSSMADP